MLLPLSFLINAFKRQQLPIINIGVKHNLDQLIRRRYLLETFLAKLFEIAISYKGLLDAGVIEGVELSY